MKNTNCLLRPIDLGEAGCGSGNSHGCKRRSRATLCFDSHGCKRRSRATLPRHAALLAVLIAAPLVAIAGCGSDYYARGLLDPSCFPGKMNEQLYNPGDLAATGRIEKACRITVADGTVIDTWILHPRFDPRDMSCRPAPKGTVVILHGWADSKATYLQLATTMAERGYCVVMPDLRGHGRTTDTFLTWGVKERCDIKQVIDALQKSNDIQGPVFAIGVSMGGTVAIQYAAEDPRCQGVVAVAPVKDFVTVANLMYGFVAQEHRDRAVVRAGEIGCFDPCEASAVKAAAKLKCPMILVHGCLDLMVPMSNSQDIYNAGCGPRKFIQVPAAGHTTILLLPQDFFVKQVEALRGGEITGQTIEVLH